MKNLHLILFLFVFSNCKTVTTPIISKTDHQSNIQGSNIGKIIFTNKYIPLNELKKTDFAETLKVSETAEVFVRMFLEKPLADYLGKLEPDLDTEGLCNNGNFQFTFFVDDKEIHQYNLQTGAGSCKGKKTQTSFSIPFIDHENPDHWGRFLWMKFMMRDGGRDALSEGPHQLKIEVRPYIKNKELKVGNIIAQGEVIWETIEKEVDESLIAIQKIQSTELWNISNETFDTEKIRTLNKKIAQDYYKEITSIAIAKNGELVLEEYFNNYNRDSLHDPRSVGKTIASTMLGIAINEGHIANDNMKLSAFYNLNSFDNYSDKKANVTLKSLLTMSSGIDGSDMDADSPGNEEYMYPTNDWVKFALDLPMNNERKIGETWDYFTAGVVLLGDILNKTVPNGLDKYAHKKLFKPLGITNYQWEYTPTNVPNTAGGFRMNTLGYAKFGQLYIDNGMSNGNQIVSKSWIKTSLSKHLQLPFNENEYYGYLLWNKTFEVDGKSYEAYYASGNGGNKVMIFKELEMVIVITATAYNKPFAHMQVDEIIQKYLLPAMLKK